MKLKEISQIDKGGLISKHIDAFIVASGFESRASFLAKSMPLNEISRKIVLAFDSHKDNPNRIENDTFFSDNNFDVINDVSGDNCEVLMGVLERLIDSFEKNEITILIDYSSMTRIWYGAIVNHIHNSTYSKEIKIIFSYSEASNNPPSEDSDTMIFDPIRNYCQLSIPSKPTALITGLGYEKNRVLGLKEYFDAEVGYYFYTDKNEYTNEIKKRNKQLISSVDETNIFPYTMKDPLLTKIILSDLCDFLGRTYRIILAPCGPKPFTLISFIVSKNYDFIDVWRISSGDSNNFLDREAMGSIVALELCYY